MSFALEKERLYNLAEAHNTKKVDNLTEKHFRSFLQTENLTLDLVCADMEKMDELIEKYFITLKGPNDSELKTSSFLTKKYALCRI